MKPVHIIKINIDNVDPDSIQEYMEIVSEKMEHRGDDIITYIMPVRLEPTSIEINWPPVSCRCR